MREGVDSRKSKAEERRSLARDARDSDASSHPWLTISGPSPRIFAEMFILKALKVDYASVHSKGLIAKICTQIV
jgi:hypothetical protein